MIGCLSLYELIDRLSRRTKELFFIQIGSNDGVTGDPLHEFIRRDNWSGIMVEPVGYIFEKLVRLNRDRRLIFENVAIAEANGKKTLYRLRQTDDPLPAWYDQLASFSLEVVESHSGAIPNMKDYLIAELVECMTFERLVQKHHVERLDLLHIDTEGYDFEIIKQIDFKRFRPMILYEHKHLGPAEEACRSLLQAHGYEVVREGAENSLAFLRA